MSKHVLTVVVAVIIGVSLLLYMFTFQVRESEKVVVLQFGSPAELQPQPGYHFKWPWPIEKVEAFDARIHVSEGKIEETRTKDSNNIIVSLCVGWRIANPLEFIKNFQSVDSEKRVEEAWARIESIIRNETLATLGNYNLSQLVNVDPNELQYDTIENDIKKKVNGEGPAPLVSAAALSPGGTVPPSALRGVKAFGIEVVLAKIRRLELPQNVTTAVYGRMRQERSLEATKFREKGNEVATVIKGRAESERDQILARAKAESERLRGEGDAKAATYYKAFDANPDLAIYLVKLRALRNNPKGKTTLVMDTTMPPWDLLVEGPPELKAPGATAPAKQPETPRVPEK